MYSVVGCTDCGALWVVAGRPDTTGCPRCDRRHQFGSLRRLFEADDEAAAKEARGRLLAERAGQDDAFAAVAAFDELEGDVDDAGLDDAYLAASGIDPDAVAAAGERADGDASSGSERSGSRREQLLAAIDALEEPSVEAVVAYTAERGVPEDAARSGLEKLRRAGELSERDGVLRQL